MAETVTIDPLRISGKKILSAFALDAEIDNWGSSPRDAYKKAPTLAQLLHAYETNAKIKEDILDNRDRGEWVSTFLRYGKEIVENPERVYVEDGTWKTEGGKTRYIKLPSEGFAIVYDKRTGFPKTTKGTKEAEKIEGSSYFWYDSDSLYAVGRVFEWFVVDDGPFCVTAIWQPDDAHRNFGYRRVHELG